MKCNVHGWTRSQKSTLFNDLYSHCIPHYFIDDIHESLSHVTVKQHAHRRIIIYQYPAYWSFSKLAHIWHFSCLIFGSWSPEKISLWIVSRSSLLNHNFVYSICCYVWLWLSYARSKYVRYTSHIPCSITISDISAQVSYPSQFNESDSLGVEIYIHLEWVSFRSNA